MSKFLRGDFNDLSENGKTLIYKWYLKFIKNPVMLHATSKQNGGHDLSTGEPLNKIIKLENNNSYSFVNMHNTPTAPKRTRFSFKLEHLTVSVDVLYDSFQSCCHL